MTIQPAGTNVTDNAPISLSTSIRKSAIGLAIFAFFTAGIIAVSQYFTKDIIEQNIKNFEARQLVSLLPQGYPANELLDSAITFAQAGIADTSLLNVSVDTAFYRAASEENQLNAVILPLVAPEGYTEAISLVVAISADATLLGVRVTSHKETPGLGDQIETAKSDWIYHFNNASLAAPLPEEWLVRKDGGEFDQFTGATITPRAIVKAVKNSLLFFDDHAEQLLASVATNEETP